MQPPPRKGNYAKFLKNLHTEQVAKLQLKNQHECDLLEDIRSFTIKRSAIEKSYSEALLKISLAYLNKKIPNIPDIKLEGGEEKWNMWNVWRTVLEENEKLAKARLAAVEVFQQQIADEAKCLRSYKVQTSRKCVEQLANIQKELQACVQEVDKTKKLYFDEEHSAHDVRDKAKDLEEKLKKKKGSFFQSITSLQKNSAKFSSKRDQLEEKSSGARNDYILCLAAANAHQNRYFVVDLQQTMATMESQVYERVAEYLTLMGRTELLTCSATQHSFGKIRDQAQQLTRDYNLQCCYLYYPVLKQHIQYDFEACDNDPIDHVTAEHESAAATLSREARRYANRIARENNNVREYVRRLQLYNALRDSGQKVDPNDQNGPDLETKIDDMRQNIRRAETAKMKAEARIECLRAGGVNVDEWVKEAETLSVQDIQRSASSLSDHPSSEYYDSDFNDGEAAPQTPQKEPSADSDEAPEEPGEVDAVLEQERQRIEQLTAGWDDPTKVDWGAEEAEAGDRGGAPEPAAPTGPIFKCTALYSYAAQNPDELSIVENEQLEVVGEGDGDGWLRARNYRGEEGFVPHNYLDVERPAAGGLQQQISFSSVDYTVDQEDLDSQPQTDTNTQSPDQDSVIAAPGATIEPITIPPEKPEFTYCCALYDYEGEGPEELSFDEGQIIKVLNKCAHGLDDGWWEGEFDGIRGNFPSLVVEECDENGEPLENDLDETPPQSAPPVFTPPEIPEDMMEPSDESPIEVPPENTKFSMELSRGQQKQYGSQFQEEGSVPPVPALVIEDEDGEMENDKDEDGDDFGLGVAQIVITAATPMIEEAEHPFPPPDDDQVANHDEDMNEEAEPEPEPEQEPEPIGKISAKETIPEAPEDESELEAEPEEPPRDQLAAKEDLNCDEADDAVDSSPFPVSSSTGSEGDTTGPSTADNSQSNTVPAPPPPPPPAAAAAEGGVAELKQVVGGRASIPDELEPHQLARLQDLKESNA